MVNKKERSYFILVLVTFALLLCFAIFSLFYLFVKIGEEKSFTNNVFELIYMGVHIVMMVMGIILSKEAINKGSNVMRSLMYTKYGQVSIRARVISLIFMAVGCGLFIYGLLIILPLGVYDFSFTTALKWDMVNVGLTIIIIAFYFFLFPFLLPSDLNKSKQ